MRGKKAGGYVQYHSVRSMMLSVEKNPPHDSTPKIHLACVIDVERITRGK